MAVTRREFLSASAAAPLLKPAQANAALPASPLLSKVRIGAEFFLNRSETRDTVFEHFRRMAGTGLTVARIFTLWDQIERDKGKWDFSGYDWIYDAAAKNGILVANTLCSEDPPGWMETAPFYHAWRDLSNPELRPYSEVYLEKVINRYKTHPAHGVWLLQNEPGIRTSTEPFAMREYARWLEKKYGSLENLNKVWYKQLRRFEDVQPPEEPRSAGWPDYESLLDWRRFQCDHLTDQLIWLRSQVDKHHPGALTHANPPGLTSNMPGGGRDMWGMKPAVHFLGASMHAAWHFNMLSRADFGIGYGFCCDLIRSVSAPAPWWVTELQAGTTVFTGGRPLNPTEGEIRRWLWDGVGNGARGIVFWLWHPRTEGNEGGEWGLAGPNGEATYRTRAAQAVAERLRDHQDFFSNAKPVSARVAILYDSDAMLLYSVDGWRRPSDEITYSLMGCYKALCRSHVPVDFIETRELEAGAASRYKALYLPYCFALSARSAEAIRKYVAGGGTIWADGLVGWKNERGVTKQLSPGPLSDVFGFTLVDIEPQWGPFSLSPDAQDRAGTLWLCVIPESAAGVLRRGPDGRAVAVEHRFGSGRAQYWATALTYGYLLKEEPAAGPWIASPAISASADLPVRMTAGSGQVVCRLLENAGRYAVVLNNWGAATDVKLRCAAPLAFTDLLSGARIASEGAEARLHLAEGASAVLMQS